MAEEVSNPTVAQEAATPQQSLPLPGIRVRNKKVGGTIAVGIRQADGTILMQDRQVATPIPSDYKTAHRILDINDDQEPPRGTVTAKMTRMSLVSAKVPIALRGSYENGRIHRIDCEKLKARLEELKPKPLPACWVIKKPKWWLSVSNSWLFKKIAKIASKLRLKRKIQLSDKEKELIIARAMGSR